MICEILDDREMVSNMLIRRPAAEEGGEGKNAKEKLKS